jgi:pimeloyl-ACP methyl ester carboxylesterase
MRPLAVLVLSVSLAVLGCARPNATGGAPPEPAVPVVAPEVSVEVGSVMSSDGTWIGYEKYGRGRPVVVCHGTHTVAADWAAFGKELGRHYTVYVYDRRGRGKSPDAGKAYTPDSEVDDLAAVVKLAGPDAAVLGHSFGGGVAVAYALRDGFKGRLVLYEPGHSAVRKVSRDRIPELQALIDQKEAEKATEFGMRQIGGLSAEEVAALKKSPLWPGMVELNRLFPRELSFLDRLTWTRADLEKLHTRTWVLLGSLSKPPAGEESRVAALVDRIPGMTLYPLVGQGHAAYLSDPALLAKVVTRCLTDE